MEIQGLELLFYSVRNEIKSKDDALVIIIHLFMIRNGCKCIGTSETWEPDPKISEGTELLPEGWNDDQTQYSLRYIQASTEQRFLVKLVPVDNLLLVNILNYNSEMTVATSFSVSRHITGDFKNFKKAYNNMTTLENQLQDELSPVFSKEQQDQSDPAQASTPSRDRLREPDPQSPYMPATYPDPVPWSPLSVGSSDLNPLNRNPMGGGGMLMDPRSLGNLYVRPGQGAGGMPYPGGLPRGVVPPGSRYDPIGAVPPGYNPRLGGPPRGPRGPNPDHLPPPGYDDMFG